MSNFISRESIYSTIYSEGEDNKLGIKECLACHKSFNPEGRNGFRQNYCKRNHFTVCPVCGKPVKQTDLSIDGIRLACAGECSKKFKTIQTKSAILDKYGVENVSQSPEFKEKISKGIRRSASKSLLTRVKTMNDRYGGFGMASPTIRKKIESTMVEKYGSTNPAKNDEIRKKISEICRSEDYQKRYAETALANWGVNRPAKTKQIQDKMKATTLARYGVECTLTTDYAKQRLAEVSMSKYGVENPLFSEYSLSRARESFLKRIHESNSKISKLNQSFSDVLKSEFGIESEFEFLIGKKSFDLHLIGTNILIEIDPTYTHSDLPNHWTPYGLDPDYHLNRTVLAQESGYKCVHIFDWDNVTKVIQTLVKPSEVIYARKCRLIEVDPKQVDAFIDENHIQGKVRNAIKAYCLIHDSEVVEVMTFGKSRYNSNFEWELLRLCTRFGTRVVGGASKLFKAFMEDVHPRSVISYCDRAKFNGSVYNRIGMKLHHYSEPAKIWSKGSEYITDNLLRQRGYDQLFNSNYGKGTSNDLLMIENGWRSVYDCGQAVYVWESDK